MVVNRSLDDRTLTVASRPAEVGPGPLVAPVVDVTDQNHVVVGAAGGIGRAIAHRLAELGARVGCLDLDGEGARRTADAIIAAGGAARHSQLDVRQQDSIDAAIEAMISEFGRIDGLINCAGTTGRTGIKTHQVEPDEFDAVWEVNLRGAFLLSRSVIPHMLNNGYGRILHLASISGKEGNEGMAAYSTTKAGLIGLVKVLGKEYARTGITINALAPAVIRTPMVDALPTSQVIYMTDKIPMGRCGTLAEVADVAAWAVSKSCSFITAFTFDLSGGRAVY